MVRKGHPTERDHGKVIDDWLWTGLPAKPLHFDIESPTEDVVSGRWFLATPYESLTTNH
jgi:hypothetical protein